MIKIIGNLLALIVRWFNWRNSPEVTKHENEQIIADGNADALNRKLDDKL